MKPTKTVQTRRWLLCLFLLALLVSLSACAGVKPNLSVQGKWEATITSKRGGQSAKVILDFLPDGAFNATPPGDTILVDKGNYQVMDEGRTVKFRSSLFNGEALCSFRGESMQCESDDSQISFKRL